MTRTTLFACEIPWARGGSYDEQSMQPFLAGLCELHQVRCLYRTFTQSGELAALLSSTNMPAANGQRVIVYLSAHGSGGRLYTEMEKSVNLLPIAKKAARAIEGIWIGACDVGASEAPEEFLRNGGASWAGGFTCAIDWKDAVLIDLAVLQAALGGHKPKNRSAVIHLFANALTAFSPTWIVDSHADIPLWKALRVWGRDRTSGPTTEDLTEDILKKLKWPTG